MGWHRCIFRRDEKGTELIARRTFAAQGRRFMVRFESGVLERIEQQCRNSGSLETGGVLVGRYSGDGHLAKILDALGPPDDSRSLPRGFVRGTRGLGRTLAIKWHEGQHYLGEWHFHPRGLSTPSGQDDRQMKAISHDKTYDSKEPILLIIGGVPTGELNMGLFVTADDQMVRLEKIELGD